MISQESGPQRSHLSPEWSWLPQGSKPWSWGRGGKGGAFCQGLSCSGRDFSTLLLLSCQIISGCISQLPSPISCWGFIQGSSAHSRFTPPPVSSICCSLPSPLWQCLCLVSLPLALPLTRQRWITICCVEHSSLVLGEIGPLLPPPEACTLSWIGAGPPDQLSTKAWWRAPRRGTWRGAVPTHCQGASS